MATKFLRKIILQELRKVLNEQVSTEYGADYPDIPGSQPGQIQTNIPSYKDPFASIPGAEPGQTSTPSGIPQSRCGAGFDRRCQPKYLKLQKELNKFAVVSNSRRIKEDGIPGKETDILFQEATGRPLKYANLKDPLSFKETILALREFIKIYQNAGVKSEPSRSGEDQSAEKTGSGSALNRGIQPIMSPEEKEAAGQRLMKTLTKGRKPQTQQKPDSETHQESLMRKEINKLLRQL